MSFTLIPKERKFYELFEQQAVNIVEAARLLKEIDTVASATDVQVKLKEIEHAGDKLTHEITQLLNRTFVTPFDREDIYSLTAGMDDLIDYSEEIADTIALYQPTTLPSAVGEMSGLILSASEQLSNAMTDLTNRRDNSDNWIEIRRLENLGDDVSREAIAELFTNGNDVLEVVKLKDIYTLLEEALDRCEDVANIVESILIKHA